MYMKFRYTVCFSLCDNLDSDKLSQSVSFYTNMAPRLHVYGKVSNNQILVYICCYTVRIYVFCRKRCLNICTYTEYSIRIYIYKYILWLRNLFREMGIGHYIEQPTVLEGDNKQAGKWGREDMITGGNRFIERQYFKR
eukprot:COSAG02_NODE_260_length_26771_cov_3110.350817_2_plen_138_part_00